MVGTLVIKPTEKCNFKCTFCSSTSISDDHDDIVEYADIIRYLERFPETKTIIVNGGDPLMMPPEYYHAIMDYADVNLPELVLSLTTNLWAFYKKPEMWLPLFKRRNVELITSFQYGDKRLKGDYTPLTEAEFLSMQELTKKELGSYLDFIAVIDQDNADTAIATVELAKRLDVEVKLNYAVSSGTVVPTKRGFMGNEGNQFLLADVYALYVEIADRGLAPWEFNTQQMAVRLRGHATVCPQTRECDAHIRTMQPSGRYYSCPALGDDDIHRIDFDAEMEGGQVSTPLSHDPTIHSMKIACYTCPMFQICNGCRKTIRDHKRLGLVEIHCRKMKTLAARIIDINGLTGSLIPTPYMDESNLIARG